ncbi:hypothetical protein BDP27DRAFT_742640 [Rhodocollybia butyracea]|uniref:Uncharacterized protein n=1 Tax=Rhodocollybia butyracea TaxID=206335 RepID=A0A9P5P7U6_9AGAR|nr:hypothetical protein BDP27DRAFT_742640 [Rhodocollybia butyracea]
MASITRSSCRGVTPILEIDPRRTQCVRSVMRAPPEWRAYSGHASTSLEYRERLSSTRWVMRDVRAVGRFDGEAFFWRWTLFAEVVFLLVLVSAFFATSRASLMPPLNDPKCSWSAANLARASSSLPLCSTPASAVGTGRDWRHLLLHLTWQPIRLLVNHRLVFTSLPPSHPSNQLNPPCYPFAVPALVCSFSMTSVDNIDSITFHLALSCSIFSAGIPARYTAAPKTTKGEEGEKTAVSVQQAVPITKRYSPRR